MMACQTRRTGRKEALRVHSISIGIGPSLLDWECMSACRRKFMYVGTVVGTYLG